MLKKKYLKFLIYFGLVLFFFLFFILLKTFFCSDISKTPLNENINKPAYLISYADGNEVFFKNQKMLAYSALKKGFSFILNYRKQSIDPSFIRKNQVIFNEKAGAGAWLWKPWIINHALSHAPEGALMLYCDSGFFIKGDLSPLFDLLEKSDMVLAQYSEEHAGLLKKSCKKEAFLKTGCAKCPKANALMAGFILMKNTARTRSFIKKWLTLCQDPDLILGHSKSQGHAHHSYDQALLGIVAVQNPQGITFVNAEDNFHKNILKWHHRKNNDLLTQDGLLARVERKLSGFERKILDSFPFKLLAYAFYKLGIAG